MAPPSTTTDDAGRRSSPPKPLETEVTAALEALRRGDEGAAAALVRLIYDDLRDLARRARRRQPARGPDTTALVHEAYLRMVPLERRTWRDRAHFLAASAQVMRSALVDAARRRLAAKRGGGHDPETLDEGIDFAVDPDHAAEVLAVDQALGRLERLDARMCRAVECLFFAGMTEKEAGEALGVSARTVHRDWLRAKAWLRAALSDAPAPDAARSGDPR